MSRCGRCYKETNITTMSFLNTQMICMDCDKEEENHPRYKEAKQAERAEVLKGNYNYEGLLNGEEL